MIYLGMTHRSKKRTRTDVEDDGRQPSRVLGNMRSNQEAPNYLSSTAVDAPETFRLRQSSMQSSVAEFRGTVSRPMDASGLPSPVSTITTTPSYETCERKNNTLIEIIIHPSHEPAPQPSQVADQQECENQEVNMAITKQMILGVCEALHISTGSYHYL